MDDGAQEGRELGLRVGELARRVGVTIRTLHHYHEIGLLVPSLHSRGEHRLYGPADLLRLQEILSLKALGLSLAEIAEVLDRPDRSEAETLETLRRHLRRVEAEVEEGRRLRERLARLVELLSSASASDRDRFDTLMETLRETKMFEKYYTPEQMEQLRQRAETVGAERMQAVQKEWSDLFAELARAHADGADPASERVLELGRRANALIEEFTGGDAGIRESLANLYRGEGQERVLEPHGMGLAPDVAGLLNQAMRAAAEAGRTQED